MIKWPVVCRKQTLALEPLRPEMPEAANYLPIDIREADTNHPPMYGLRGSRRLQPWNLEVLNNEYIALCHDN